MGGRSWRRGRVGEGLGGVARGQVLAAGRGEGGIGGGAGEEGVILRTVEGIFGGGMSRGGSKYCGVGANMLAEDGKTF